MPINSPTATSTLALGGLSQRVCALFKWAPERKTMGAPLVADLRQRTDARGEGNARRAKRVKLCIFKLAGAASQWRCAASILMSKRATVALEEPAHVAAASRQAQT